MINHLLRLCLLAMLLIACEETIVPPETADPFAYEILRSPSQLNIKNPTLYELRVRTSHPAGPAGVESVIMEFFGADQVTLLQSIELLDDGEGNGSGSRDVVARDGVFSNIVLSDSNVFEEGDIFWQVTVDGGSEGQIQGVPFRIRALFNSAPEILSFTIPDTLFSGEGTTISAQIQDTDGTDNLAGVSFSVLRDEVPLKGFNLLQTAIIDSITAEYQLPLDSSFAAGLKGDYEAVLFASDIPGTSENVSELNLFIENEPPVIKAIGLRNSLQLPSVGSDTLHVKCRIDDEQGLLDVADVTFTVTLIGGNTSDPIAMFDDGNSSISDNGDLRAADGQYSQVVSIAATNQAGPYVFEFSATDKAGNTAATVNDTLVVN